MPMSEPKLYWDSFRITVSFPMECPLCKAQIEPFVEHACSNPEPKAKPAKTKRAGRESQMNYSTMPAVGDRGQRYEVRYFDRTTGAEKVFGWTNAADGGAFMESAKLAPWARDPFVVDRSAPRADGDAQ